MAETLTYDAGTDTVTTGDTLTPDEQNSLEVGEAIVEQQEGLLAGKYKDAAELEKAYVELQSKLGEKGDKDNESTNETEVQESEEVQEEEEGFTEVDKPYLEDGSVNYEAVNETYGSKLGELFKDSNVDPFSISKHFHENEGTITDDMYASLEGAGLSRSSIDAYLAGRAAESGYNTSQSNDISDAAVSEVKNFAGGDEAYSNMVNWASENLDQKSIAAFDEIINTGSVDSIKLAVTALKSQYDNANGYEGQMYSGKAPKTSKDVFRSQAELVAAMSDRRYDRDPAYRQDVIDKLERSDNLSF